LRGPISITVAALGGELDVPTLDGKLKLKIPAGTQTVRCSACAGRASARARRRLGDLICRVVVETPVNLTDDQKSCSPAGRHARGGGSRHTAVHRLAGRREEVLRGLGF